MSRMPASPPSPAVRVAAAVAPCARDPRVRTELPVDPRLQSSASFHQTAVVLPTQAKPSSSTSTTQPDGATQVEPQPASSGTVENIFDRLLKDLKPVKSESAKVPHVADSGACTAAVSELKVDSSSAAAAEPSASKDHPEVNQETDDSKRAVASPTQAEDTTLDGGCNESRIKPKEAQLKDDLHLAASHSPTPSGARTKHSDTAYDEIDGLGHTRDGGRRSDRQSWRGGELRSSRRRASSQDREKLREVIQQRTEVHGKEKDTGPASKRMRRDRQHTELKNIDSSASLPNDFM